jgi:peptide/nickel transport system substrate-binding protein
MYEKRGLMALTRRLISALCMVAVLLTACRTLQPSVGTEIEPTSTPALPAVASTDTLQLLFWQAPTNLNPHLAQSATDRAAFRITYEPLASHDSEGNLVPFLAAEIPTLENGGVATDGKSVTWKLRSDVRWSDGEPFTADDVLFTYEFITDPAMGAKTRGTYGAVEGIDVINSTTLRIRFKDVNPAWATPFVGINGMIMPRHVFDGYNPSNPEEQAANLVPVGTGPYRVIAPGIKPQEVLLVGTQIVETNKLVFETNSYYRDLDRLAFGTIVIRGGGTVREAARSVLVSGSVDFTPNLQLLDSMTLESLANEGSAGQVLTLFGPYVERILINQTDPNQATRDGERSSLQYPHPFFSDLRVRQALAYAIDRDRIALLYGPAGRATPNMLVSPAGFASPHTSYAFDIEQAARLLDQAGWRDTDGDGIRDKNGVKMSVLYQTTAANRERQNTQAIVKEDLESLGIEVILKLIDSSIFLGSDPDNPNTRYHFYADLEQFATGNLSPDPGPYMEWWTCDQIAQKSNNWTGRNIERWCNPDFDALYHASTTEMNPERRRDLFIQMNDMIINEVVLIPIGHRATLSGIGNDIEGVELTPWDAETWQIHDWRRASP